MATEPIERPAKRDKTIPGEFPAHRHLKYYGYSLVGEFNDYRDEIRKLAEYTNLLSFTTHEIGSQQLEALSTRERQARYASAAEKMRFAESLGLTVNFINVAGPLMRRTDSREPWLEYLRELKDNLGDELARAYSFYIVDEPDIRDITGDEIARWIDEFKTVFPDVRCSSTYALVNWSKDMEPPDNLEIVAIDPYIGFPVRDPAYDFISQYNERFHQALDWVQRLDGRRAVMVGDAYVARNADEVNPMPELHDSLWFLYLALADKKFEALVWFYYGQHIDDENLDGLRLGRFPETERTHRQIGNALLRWQKPNLESCCEGP